jgi:hypothetical protein
VENKAGRGNGCKGNNYLEGRKYRYGENREATKEWDKINSLQS